MGDEPRNDGTGGHQHHERRIDREFAEELVETLRPIVDAETRRSGLGRVREDLFQEAFRRCWQAYLESGRVPSRAEILDDVCRVAGEVLRDWRHVTTWEPSNLSQLPLDRDLKRIDAAGGRTVPFDPVRAPGMGVPKLARRIMAPAWHTRHERRIARTIRKAAYVVAPRTGVLRDGTYRTFTFAYIFGWSAAEIAVELGRGNEKVSETAVTQRLEKIATRVEISLIERMRERDPGLIRTRASTDGDGAASEGKVAPEEKSIFVSAPATTICVRAILALGEILPETRGSATP